MRCSIYPKLADLSKKMTPPRLAQLGGVLFTFSRTRMTPHTPLQYNAYLL